MQYKLTYLFSFANEPYKIYSKKYLPTAYYMQYDMPGALRNSEINSVFKTFKHVFLTIK